MQDSMKPGGVNQHLIEKGIEPYIISAIAEGQKGADAGVVFKWKAPAFQVMAASRALRQATMKLAQDVPEMRKHLLPILQRTASRPPDKSGRGWRLKDDRFGKRWGWDDRVNNVAFMVLEKPGPGMPIYTLQALTDNGMFKHIKPFQWKDPKGAFAAAAEWYPALAGETAFADLTTNWSKMASQRA
jgi:hypothetical protein